ncbi:Hsp20/alpha crystallin family protein [Pollutibacter soli]|uniref:Hsp20/alpha crystallin family protein n=1 Tax=Pollutibacter soli TaxID=3034157 RepID=UPI003013F747
MKSTFTNLNDQSYPGHFVHPADQREIIEGDDQMTTGLWKKLPIVIHESETGISIDVTLPGMKREDFLVTASDNVLTIADIRNPNVEKEAPRLSPFTNHPPACFIRQIHLPESADPEFLSAEYADGVLRMVITKHQSRSENRYCKIAVY